MVVSTACVSRETPAGSSMHPTYNMLLQTCGIRRAAPGGWRMACAVLATEAGKPHWPAWGSAHTCRTSLPVVELECSQHSEALANRLNGQSVAPALAATGVSASQCNVPVDIHRLKAV